MTEQHVEIREATVVDDALVEAMARLVPQLSNSNLAPDEAALSAIVESDTSILLLAEIGRASCRERV